MRSCRLQQQMSVNRSLYCDLEDYVCEIEHQQAHSSGDNDDVFAQLAKKEKELILAAELGKALLEKNEELSRANEKLTEEYSHQLELLEQEKHALRRKLDSLEGEYESRVGELQSDVIELQKELVEQQTFLRSYEKEKSQMIQELTEQNHRLTVELKQASLSEKQLTVQIEALKEKFNVRSSNINDHMIQLEGLREEIELLEERKHNLEQKIHTLAEDRESLNLSLEESSNKILMLQRRNREKEQHVRNQQRDLEELQQTNSHLQEKLDLVLDKTSKFGLSSLYSEVESLTQLIEKNESNENEDEKDSEYEKYKLDLLDNLSLSQKLQQDLVTIYLQVWRLCDDLRRRKDGFSVDSGISSTPGEMQANQFKIGMLTSLLKELQELVDDMLTSVDMQHCLACQTIVEESDLVESLQKELQHKSEELSEKAEEISHITKKMAVQKAELAALKEERDHLRQDVGCSSMAKDEIIKKVWTMRDQAVLRKNTVEIELAKTRIDVMHINSQLIEAVQQKVELSQQLEQWQVDLQALLEEQMKKKLKTHELEETKHIRGQAHRRFGTKHKLFGLWR